MSADAPSDRAECRPCRGTGRVVSSLGGSPGQVECPWCEGTGRFRPDGDAQARRREAAGDAPAP